MFNLGMNVLKSQHNMLGSNCAVSVIQYPLRLKVTSWETFPDTKSSNQPTCCKINTTNIHFTGIDMWEPSGGPQFFCYNNQLWVLKCFYACFLSTRLSSGCHCELAVHVSHLNDGVNQGFSRILSFPLTLWTEGSRFSIE